MSKGSDQVWFAHAYGPKQYVPVKENQSNDQTKQTLAYCVNQHTCPYYKTDSTKDLNHEFSFTTIATTSTKTE